MPRSFGILLIAAAALLAGAYAWFAIVWLLSAIAKAAGTHALDVVLLLLAPHLGGWLFALLLAVAAFIAGWRLARRRGIAWLGFAAPGASAGTDADSGAPRPRTRAD
jgi:UPF0716 family protein affecting phage T7 exclusion